MKTYKHYSFDLTPSLVETTYDFYDNLSLYFLKLSPTYTRNGILDLIYEVEQMGRLLNQQSGKSIDGHQLILTILYRLEYDIENMPFRKGIESIYEQVESIFFKNPPIIDNTIGNIFKELKKRKATISILSNTGIIKGKTWCKFLKENGLWKYIDFEIYSDDLDMSKPNQGLFSMMIYDAMKNAKPEIITHEDIIHVGSSDTLDFKTAIQAKIKGFLLMGGPEGLKELINK